MLLGVSAYNLAECVHFYCDRVSSRAGSSGPSDCVISDRHIRLSHSRSRADNNIDSHRRGSIKVRLPFNISNTYDRSHRNEFVAIIVGLGQQIPCNRRRSVCIYRRFFPRSIGK